MAVIRSLPKPLILVLRIACCILRLYVSVPNPNLTLQKVFDH